MHRDRLSGRFVPDAAAPVVPGANLAGGVLQVRAATDTDWAAAAPVLARAETAYVLDADGNTIGQKVGNGYTGWSALPLIPLGTGTAPLLTPPTTVTYNGDGTVATQTIGGVATTYTYNGDGTVATETRAGVTRTYSYTSGNLTSVA